LLRQIRVFLDEGDVAWLVRELSDPAPARVLRGRYCRTAADGTTETAQASPGEERIHLVWPGPSPLIVTHPVASGPHAGWTALDERRSEVLTVVRVDPDERGLAPSSVEAFIHLQTPAGKVGKSAGFASWVARSLSRVEELCPPTERPWLRAAPGARRQAVQGLVLHYLGRSVDPQLDAGSMRQRTGPGAGGGDPISQ